MSRPHFPVAASFVLVCTLGLGLVSIQAQVVEIAPLIVEGKPDAPLRPGHSHLTLAPTPSTALPSLQNLAGRVPNLGASDGRSSSYGDLISLRGVSNTPFFTDAAVGVYLDDLPLASTFAFPVGLFGYESADVYRGPQGARFGRAGEAGVIVLNSPAWERPAGGQLEVGLGDFALRRASASVRGASTDGALAAYVDAAHFERDGFIDNLTTGRRVDDVDQTFARAGLRWQAADNATVTLRLLGGRTRNGAQPLVPVGGPLDTVTREADGEIHVDSVGASAKAEFTFDPGTLAIVAGVTDWSLDPYTNVLDLGISLDSEIHQDQRQWSQNVQWRAAPTDTLTWNLGAFAAQVETNGSIARGLTGLFLIEASDFALSADTTALLGNASVRVRDDLTLDFGLRLERTRKTFHRAELVPGDARYRDDQTFDSLQPSLAGDYALTDRTHLTAAIAIGEKPGGWSSFTGTRELARFDAERLLSAEVGLRTANATDTLRASATLFWYSIDDYQIERSFTETEYLVVNAPHARSRGGELEIDWRPAPAWRFTAAAGLTDITLREFTDPYSGINYAGRRAPYAPGHTLALGGAWQGASGWFARADVVRTGSAYYDESEQPSSRADARTVVDVAAGFARGAWRVTLAATNLFDEGYYSLLIPSTGHGVPGAPRQVALTTAWQW